MWSFLKEFIFKGSSLIEQITPSDPEQRGAQISIKINGGYVDKIFEQLEKRGIVVRVYFFN